MNISHLLPIKQWSVRKYPDITLEELWARNQLLDDDEEITEENIVEKLRQKFDFDNEDDLYDLLGLYHGETQAGYFRDTQHRNRAFHIYASMSIKELEIICES